jgi:hypothetical protein
LGVAAALATGQVSMGAVRKGWNLVKELSDPTTFLRGHSESPPELARAAS